MANAVFCWHQTCVEEKMKFHWVLYKPDSNMHFFMNDPRLNFLLLIVKPFKSIPDAISFSPLI